MIKMIVFPPSQNRKNYSKKLLTCHIWWPLYQLHCNKWRTALVQVYKLFCAVLQSFVHWAELLRQQKAYQKLGVGRKLFGLWRKQVYEIDPW